MLCPGAGPWEKKLDNRHSLVNRNQGLIGTFGLSMQDCKWPGLPFPRDSGALSGKTENTAQ